MITNEKQYKVTKKKLQVLYEEIDRITAGRKELPAEDELVLVSMQVFRNQLEKELLAYDLLKTKTPADLEERKIDDLPALLIEFKILSGLTQKEFSQKIGMKEQQLQRYEAENFDSISFRNLLKILHAVGLAITVKASIP